MELLVDTNTLIDLAAFDSLDFLLAHAFYVSPELADMLGDPDNVTKLETAGNRASEYAEAVNRLKAFQHVCKEPPVGDFRDAILWASRVHLSN